MSANATHMRREIDEIPEAAVRLLDGSASALAEAGRGLR
ncbi:MAG: aminotransferase, partial [Mesorhizobium sp.]